MHTFPIRINNADDSVKHIFPSKQKDVQAVINIARQNAEIKRLIVFGSATTLNCGIDSDIDIAVDAPDIKQEDDFLVLSRRIRQAIHSSADVIHYNSVQSDLLKKEIDMKGVEVYVNGI